MKTVLTLASIVLLSSVAVGAVARATNHPATLAASQNQPGQSADPKTQTKAQTFVGTITKSGSQFVFSDDANNLSYQLDDQETASKFEGKKVRVTGTLDAASKIIRVQSIEATA